MLVKYTPKTCFINEASELQCAAGWKNQQNYLFREYRNIWVMGFQFCPVVRGQPQKIP